MDESVMFVFMKAVEVHDARLAKRGDRRLGDIDRKSFRCHATEY